MTPRIYVADLAAYNNGILHGEWLDATEDLDTLNSAINAMLKASPIPNAEEYAIHDYEGFYSYQIGEYTGINTVQSIAGFIEKHAELGAEILTHWSGNLEQAIQAMEEDYYGCYQSLTDYAQELTKNTIEIPESLEFYIDYEAMARDMLLSGDVYTIQLAHDEVHVFWNR